MSMYGTRPDTFSAADVCEFPALRWNNRIDSFAIGCLLAELHLGYPLFYECRKMEHLAVMERILGRFPIRFVTDIERSQPGTFRQGDPAVINYPMLVSDGQPVPPHVQAAKERLRVLHNINVGSMISLVLTSSLIDP
jgi:hypothetical protein